MNPDSKGFCVIKPSECRDMILDVLGDFSLISETECPA